MIISLVSTKQATTCLCLARLCIDPVGKKHPHLLTHRRSLFVHKYCFHPLQNQAASPAKWGQYKWVRCSSEAADMEVYLLRLMCPSQRRQISKYIPLLIMHVFTTDNNRQDWPFTALINSQLSKMSFKNSKTVHRWIYIKYFTRSHQLGSFCEKLTRSPCVWVFPGYSDFLPQPQNVNIRLGQDCKLMCEMCVSVGWTGCLSSVDCCQAPCNTTQD